MSKITQRISNFFGGVSQQADSKKRPGQLKEAVNVFPDYALGMLKRPGGKFEAELNNASTSGRWFPILRDDQEKYVVQYDDDQFRVWSILDGQPRAVDMGTGTGVPGGCNLTNLKSDLGTYRSAIDTTATELTDLNNAQATFAEVTDGQNTTTSVLFDVDTTYSGGEYNVDLYSGVLENRTTLQKIVKENGTVVATVASGDPMPTNYAVGNDRADEHPLFIREGFNVYELNKTIAATHTAGDLTTATTDMGTAQTAYDNAVTAEGTAKTNYESEVTACDPTAPSTAYLYGADPEDIEIVTVNDYTFVLNKNKVTAMKTDAADLSPALPNQAFVVIAIVSYDTLYTIDLAGTKYSFKTDKSPLVVQQKEIDFDANYVVSKLVDEINNPRVDNTYYCDDTNPTTVTITDVGHGLTTGDTISWRRTGSESVYSVSGDSGTASFFEPNSGLAQDETFQVEILSGGANEGIYIRTDAGGNTVEYRDYLGARQKGRLRRLLTENYSNYTVTVVDSDTYTISLDLVNGAATSFTLQGTGEREVTQTFTATAAGAGIYITPVTSSTTFVAETSTSSNEKVLYHFQNEITVSGKLPVSCKDGYVVNIINSEDVTADDTWVKFSTSGSYTYGEGVWQETVAPGLPYQIDNTTMPHQLIRQADGSFKYEPVTWINREVGDDDTNPIPSFIGEKINSIFFHRNRLGFLSNESMILSKSGDFFNFFGTTAQDITDDDPIDIQATSVRPVTLNYVLEAPVGLVLFGPNEQFVMSTNEDILSPKTARIGTLSNYECDSQVNAVPLGTSLAFVTKSTLYTKLLEILNVQRETSAIIDESTRSVPEYIPSDVDSMISSPALSMVSIGKAGSSTLYQYRFFVQGQARQQTWYKWELTGNLLTQFFDKTTFYAVTYAGSNVYLTSYDLTQSSEQGYLTLPTGEKTDVCLDMFVINPYRTYNETDDETTITLPFDHITSKTLSVIVLGNYIGDPVTPTEQAEGAVLYPPDDAISGNQVTIDGDFRGKDIILGYIYNMTIEMPVFYATQEDGQISRSDINADLILHRAKVSTGLSGPVKYQIDVLGKDSVLLATRSDTVNVTLPNTYVLNNVNLSANAVHDVPIHQRNTSVKFKIIGDTPFPVSLLSMEWEGNYNRRFYRQT